LQPNVKDEEEVLRREYQTGMSVNEKMLLWAKKPQDLVEPINPSECFQGVEEREEDDRTSNSEVLTYSRTILRNKAYRWMVQQLLKELSFHWGYGPRIMVDEIRSAIINGLPTGRVSKHRDPQAHRVEFQVPWARLHQRMLWERKNMRAGHWSPWNWGQISKSMVLVSPSEDSILATTVVEYVAQTWGQSRELLTKFLMVLERELCSGGYALGMRQPRLLLPGTWRRITKAWH
jgi:hypothetical protein